MEGPFNTADVINYGLLKEFSRENRKNPTEAEVVLWKYICEGVDGWKFRRQHIIGNFIADFVCLRKQLIIELDGGYHFKEEQQRSDEERTKYLNERGFEVIRFTNEEVLFNTDNVIEKIKKELAPPRPSPQGRERPAGIETE